MSSSILYLGDTDLTDAAAYLAGVMTHAGLRFDYVPSDRAADAALFDEPRGLYILSDYPAAQLTDTLQQRMLADVSGGAGLLMCGGWESFHGLGGDWDGTPVAAALPVTISTEDDRMNCDHPVLLRRAESHSLLEGLPWESRPPVIGGFNRVAVGPAGQVLLEAVHFSACVDGESFAFERTAVDPLLVVGTHGEGRTAALMTDVAPHWVGPLVDWGDGRVAAQAENANEIEVGDLYARFLQQLIAWTGRRQTVGETYPTKWSAEDNVVWKTKVPGRGHASPTIVGDNVFLATADESRKLQSVVCFDRNTGDLRWRKDVHEGGLGKLDHKDTSFASSTVGCDGHRVFAVFRNDDNIVVTALDLDGKLLWQTKLGGHSTSWGFAASPVIYKKLVIIAADSDGGGFVAAVDRKNGEIWWRKTRHSANVYSSAVVATVAGKDQLLMSGGEKVMGYDPMTGEELWSAEACPGVTCGTMVWQGDLVFAGSGYGGSKTAAVKADGSSGVVWQTGEFNSYVPSMLAHDGHLYMVENGGIAYCVHAASGKVAWKKRIGGSFYASPILAGGNVYITDRRGKITIFKANPKKYEPVASNRLGDAMDATPVACGGKLFLRVVEHSGENRQEMLYCIGK
eukprot:g32976.t1